MKEAKSHNEEDFRYRGAGVLVELHDRQLRRFLDAWRQADAAGVNLPVVDDPDYASLDALLRHVLRWSRGYLVWVCEKLQLPDPGVREVPAVGATRSEAADYLEEVLDAWKGPLVEIEAERFFLTEYTSPWGVQYCIEAMLEHAVMHAVRHRHQLERLLAAQQSSPA